MKFVVSTLSVAVLAVGALVAAPAASVAVTGVLPITTLNDLVVDQAHGKVFISGGPIVVADLSGAVTGSVSGVTNAGRTTLTADGGKLVAVTGSAFTVIDTTTGTVDKVVPAGANVCPGSVAPASGKIFFSYLPCDGTGSGGLGAVDLTTEAVTTGLLGNGTTYGGDGEIAGTPGAPSLLGAVSFENIYVLDTTGGTTPTATIRAENSAASDSYVALNPAGTELYTRDFFGPLDGYDTDNLEVAHTYQAFSSHASSVAVRSDGYLAVGGPEQTAPDIALYQAGAAHPDRTSISGARPFRGTRRSCKHGDWPSVPKSCTR